MLDSLFVRASLAGIGVALAAGPLGSFVVWRRMAYFSDATAHASILGVAMALAFDISIFSGALLMAIIMALGVQSLTSRGRSMDTALGVLSYSALAIGMVAVSLTSGVRIDISALLFGEILIVQGADLALIWGGAAVVFALLWWRWSALLTATVSPELAQAAGLNPRVEQFILTIALALTVAVAIKVVGVLLIGALLIIPAAAARPFSSTPERMAVLATVGGVVSVLVGLSAAWEFDVLAGPAIVCAAAALFVTSMLVQGVRALRSDG
ncbi:metal ABC transporter permease [Gymnodinialimonas ceratoperidinii]|uniref:Metal ABC transporter permease n=1 Tax=Gymnodinialimonas ceratoperidinii TaxID=2856823 RepID=A0A8F6U0N6_9RHOB|nr:metal ABC transporter permease [Gymnodinialimonas ceratoperidinii]